MNNNAGDEKAIDLAGISGMSLNTELTIVIPVYNEPAIAVEAICKLVETMGTSGLAVEILVVDDGSSDGTSEELKAVEGIRLIRHRRNRGYGAALKTGIAASGSPWLAITDADGTYPNDRIPDLLATAKDEEADMVVGSRTGGKVQIPLVRRPAKWMITRLASYLSGHRIPDLNSGLRIFRRSALVPYLGMLPDGFSFTTTITLAHLTNNRPVVYVPIDYFKRGGKGGSKIRPINDTANFIQLIVRMVMYFNPLRVFIPMSLTLFAASLGALIYRAVRGGGLGAVSVILFIAGFQMLATGMLADLIDRRLMLSSKDKEQGEP